MRTVAIVCLGLLLGFINTFGQNRQPDWALVNKLPKGSPSQSLQAYKVFQTDFNKLTDWLVQSASADETIEILLPSPDGLLRPFRIKETPILQSPLREKFDQIKTYSGVCMNDASMILKMDITPSGLHAMILSNSLGTVYIDPFNKSDLHFYIAYFRKDYAGRPVDLECFNRDFDIPPAYQLNTDNNLRDCQLRSYRLALAATAEYTAYHGGKANALAAQVTTINRVNGVYERDLGIQLNIIGNNDLLIYEDAETDPYTNSNINLLQSENQRNIDEVIGTDEYDIGHVFFRAAPNGLADYYAACNSESKARGASGNQTPEGNPFDVSLVMHEMGHQFGANHTQSNNNTCGEWEPTAVEPGSGSTIMSYAGICAPNIQDDSDDYFHVISLQEIGSFITSDQHNCPVTSPLSNIPPEVEVDQFVYSIPSATPFVLEAVGLDNDKDSLSYCWEQTDNGINSMPPSSFALTGPLFRSLPPKTSSKRFFPDLTDLSNNESPEWEALSSVARPLNFKVTVRDNATGGGCIASDSIRINVIEQEEVFQVTRPNEGNDFWASGDVQAIQWVVAGTDTGAINCKNVDIFLSVDGGIHFPIMLVQNVPNNGEALVSTPDLATDSARIMIKCSDNLFFDISDSNLKIDKLTDTDHFLKNDSEIKLYPNPTKGPFSISAPSASGPASIQLFNQLGAVIYQADIGYLHQRTQVVYLPESISSGVYTVILRFPDAHVVKKLSIVK